MERRQVCVAILLDCFITAKSVTQQSEEELALREAADQRLFINTLDPLLEVIFFVAAVITAAATSGPINTCGKRAVSGFSTKRTQYHTLSTQTLAIMPRALIRGVLQVLTANHSDDADLSSRLQHLFKVCAQHTPTPTSVHAETLLHAKSL